MADCGDVRQGYRRIAVRAHRVHYRIREGANELVRVLHTSVDVRSRLRE